MTNFNSRWRTDAILKNVDSGITRLSMDQFRCNLGGRILSHQQHVRHDAVAMVTSAVNIRHLWASAGRTRASISMKFGRSNVTKPPTSLHGSSCHGNAHCLATVHSTSRL